MLSVLNKIYVRPAPVNAFLLFISRVVECKCSKAGRPQVHTSTKVIGHLTIGIIEKKVVRPTSLDRLKIDIVRQLPAVINQWRKTKVSYRCRFTAQAYTQPMVALGISFDDSCKQEQQKQRTQYQLHTGQK